VPLSALALVMTAALVHSLWNLWLKSGRWSLGHWLWSVLVSLALYAPALVLFPAGGVPGEVWIMIAASGLFQAAYCVALNAAYGAGELSLVYPIVRGTSPVVIAALSVLFLGERLSPLGLVAIGLVVVGLFTTHLGGMRGWAALVRSRASALAVLAGLTIVGYSLIDKRAVAAMPPPVYIWLVHVVCVAAIAGVMLARGLPLGLPPGGADRRAVLGVGAFSFGGYLLVLFAMRLAPVSYVVAAREISVVFATILGVAVLGERVRPARLAGAAAVFLGLAGLALSR